MIRHWKLWVGIVATGFVLGFVLGIPFDYALKQLPTTVYADGFSKRVFNDIKLGTSVQEALDRLGPPRVVVGLVPRLSLSEYFAWSNDVLQKEPYKSEGTFDLYYSTGINGVINDCRCYLLVIRNGIIVQKHLTTYD